MGCIPVSLVWRNTYWECGCDCGSEAQPRCAVWVCIWDKQFYMFLFWNFIKPSGLKFLHSQTFLLWETEQENTLLKVKMTGSSANIKPVVQCPCTWPCTGTAVTRRLQQHGAGGCPGCLPWTPVFPGLWGLLAAREAILTGWALDRDQHLQCWASLPPRHCMPAAVCRLDNASGSSAPLSPCPAQGSLLLAFLG